MLLFTGIIAIATSVYVGVAIWQWRVMSGTLAQMHKTAHLEQRAWVGFNRGTAQEIAKGKPIECELRFTNTGKTPACKIQARSKIDVMPNNCDMDAVGKEWEGQEWSEDASQRTLAPNAEMVIYVSSPKTADQYPAEMNGAPNSIYVFGRITYDDFFGAHHETRYCFTHSPIIKKSKLTPHHQYNHMD